VGKFFADDLQVVAIVADSFAGAEVQDNPTVGYPMIAIEAEDRGAYR
jgi:hypothetical protein